MVKKILIVHNYYQIPGGEDTVVASEKLMLEEHGHKVILYTRNNAELNGMSKIRKLMLPLDTIFSIRTYNQVKNIIKNNKIDIVHVHNTLNLVSPSVYYAAFACYVPVVQTMHNFRFMCPSAELYRDGKICEDCTNCNKCGGLLNAIAHKCYRNSFVNTLASVLTLKIHRILGTYRRINYICLTEFNKEKLLLLNKKKNVINENKVFVKPNFTDCEEHLVNQIKTEDSQNYYVYVGRLEKIKGIYTILKAFSKKSCKLKVLGTGTEETRIKKVLEKNNIKNVELLGYKEKKERDILVSNAKAIIVAPKWYETFGMTVIEAFALKTPVIVGDIGNAGGLVTDGVTGLKFKYNSSKSLAEVVERFENMDLMAIKNMTDSAYNSYKDKYSKEVNYSMLSKIYEACR